MGHPDAGLTGRVFERLTVEARAGTLRRGGRSFALWACVCACGGRKVASTRALQAGDVRSCGCLELERRERLREIGKRGGKHG
jgi:hypothetical protein